MASYPPTHRSAADIERAVQEYLVGQSVPAGDASPPAPDQDLFTTGVVDSLSIMRLIAHVRETFEVAIGPRDMKPEHFRTIHCIAAFVQQKQADGQTHPG